MIEGIESLIKDNKSQTAWTSYKDVVLALSRGKSVLEIGAGRYPIFTAQEIRENNISYVANDIMESELDLVPFDVEKAVFDITGDIPIEFLGKFDFIFSKMVQEHVSDGERFYKNIHKLLSDNSLSLNFFPTLYHPIFIMNYVLPDKISRIILQKFHPNRNIQGIPKFPAHYHYCFSVDRQVEKLRRCGFQDVWIIPFYGQSYLKKVHFISSVADVMDEFFRNNDIRLFSSFAYSIVKK